MQISRSLKLVLPIYEGDELRLSVYAEPLSRLAFESNHKIMARTWSDLNAADIGSIGLMTTAAFSLKEAAIALYGRKDDPVPGITRYETLMTEMLRTAQAIIPQSGGWTPVPYDNAKHSGLISEDDAATVESLIAFFTLASRMVDPHWSEILRTSIRLNYGAQFTSLSCMEYTTSLKTSIKDAPTGKPTT